MARYCAARDGRTLHDQRFRNQRRRSRPRRGRRPVLIGSLGPSSSGKTYSGLRLATGIQTVYGGDIFVVDTEQRRSLHYADRFKFKHVDFQAPYGSLDYLDALRYAKKQGAGAPSSTAVLTNTMDRAAFSSSTTPN